MTTLKKIIGLLVALAGIVGVVAFGAARATASNAPIVIQYQKTCNEFGQCGGTLNGVNINMQVTNFRATGDAAQLTLTESITSARISFSAVMNGTRSAAGFIVLNGTVTDGPYAGAQVHQRSTYIGGPPNASEWTGVLQVAPAS
jgi:hypothetical protein